MKKIKVILIEDDTNLICMLKNYFKQNKYIDIINFAHNGIEGIELINNNLNYFDVLVLDLIMPKKDGMFVLNEMKKQNIAKNTIVVSAYNSSKIIKEVAYLGTDYFILKPYDFKDLEERIISVFSNVMGNSLSDNLKKLLTTILHELGVPSNIKGYQYMKDAIDIVFSRPLLICEITKQIYPLIALKYSTTDIRVERAIRHAIEISWSRGNIELIEQLFGSSINYNKSRPTNSEYISTIAEVLKEESIYLV